MCRDSGTGIFQLTLRNFVASFCHGVQDISGACMQWAHCFVVGIVSGRRVSAYCRGVFGACGGSRGIWDWLWLLWGVAHSGRGLVSIFQVSSSIGGAFILAGGLGAGL